MSNSFLVARQAGLAAISKYKNEHFHGLVTHRALL